MGGCSSGGRRRARRSRRSRRSLGTIGAIGLAAIALTACVADLGTLGGPTARAAGISWDGAIVGTSTNEAGFDHAFLWDQTTGTMRDLGAPGGVWSHASAVSNTLVVGWVDTADFQSIGTVWSRDGWSIPLVHDGFDVGIPLAVSDGGFVAGYVANHTSPATRTGAVWGPDAELYTFSVSSASHLEGTTANDVNSTGQAVGTADLTPFVWDRVNGVRSLIVPTVNSHPAYAYAEAINDRGDVVGSIRDANGDQQSVVWDAATSERRDPARPAGVSSYLVDVNNSGMAIGLTRGPFPALWTSYCVSLDTGRITDLGNTVVVAINDDGVITGLSDGRSVRWSNDSCAH